MAQNQEFEEDFLEVDQPIPGQNYACLSFISPEKIVRQKEIYFFKKFVYDLLTDEKKREYLLNFNAEKLTYEKINDMIEDYRILHEKNIYDEFDESTDFKTSVRGVKVRGIYDTLKEARVRAKVLQRKDPKFNVFVGQVGYWLPWDPSSTDDIEAEYQEKQLNELMKNYKVNAEQRDMFYAEEKQRKMEEAVKENAKRKKENIEKGYIDPEKAPKEDATSKIGELREIMDQKDALFNQVLEKSNVNRKAGGTTEAAITTDQETVNDTSNVKDLDDTSNTTSDKNENDMFTSRYSDPWLKRKTEGEKPLPPPNNSEVMNHDANNVTGEEDNNLDSVSKNIF